MQLSPADIGHQSILLDGFYELALSRKIVHLARSGGTLVDVGANYGYFSILWLAQNKQNRSVAFEAAPYNWDALNANIEQNGLSEQCVLVPKALSHQSGQVEFDPQHSDGQTGWGGIALKNTMNTIRVPATTLDAYWMANFPDKVIEVLKIDVEGADTLVLQGAEQLLRKKRIQHIFFEINRPRMEQLQISADLAETFLKSLGYQMETIDRNEIHAYL